MIAHPECLPAVRAADRPASDLDRRAAAGGSTRRVAGWRTRASRPTFDRLMLEFDEPAVEEPAGRTGRERRRPRAGDADPEALLQELDRRPSSERRSSSSARRRLVALREGGLDDSQETELLEKIIRQERSRQGISEPTDG